MMRKQSRGPQARIGKPAGGGVSGRGGSSGSDATFVIAFSEDWPVEFEFARELDGAGRK